MTRLLETEICNETSIETEYAMTRLQKQIKEWHVY